MLIIFLTQSTNAIRPPGHDAPVQGPLPYEPDDAPWKKSSESGIRKLWVPSERDFSNYTYIYIYMSWRIFNVVYYSYSFRKLFSDPSDGNNTFPKRSLATLSKMALSATPGSGSEPK